jgi:hypothetical protein
MLWSGMCIHPIADVRAFAFSQETIESAEYAVVTPFMIAQLTEQAHASTNSS